MPRGEMGGGELVYRLVAATPPYLFSQAGVPHAFFFSELLRGLVEARAKRPPSPAPAALQGGGGPPAAKRIRSASGSAFGAPGSRASSMSPTNEEPTLTPLPAPTPPNPLSTSRLIPRLASLYRTVRETSQTPHSPVIGLELLVVGPQPPPPPPLKHEIDLERKS